MESIITEIQKELKAGKNQYNSYGGYRYRSCEDIVEAVKPVLHKRDCYLVMSDEVFLVGERYYVRARVAIKGACEEEAVAFAREPESKKGMSPAQLTGTASSYARKYALQGLLALDDAKDPDTEEYQHVAKDSKMNKLLEKDEL